MALSPNFHTIFATLSSSSNAASSSSPFPRFHFYNKPTKNNSDNLSITLLGSANDGKWRLSVSFFPAFFKKGKDVKVLKEKLLEAIAPLDRGADATPEDQQGVDQIARKLEAVNPIKEPLNSDLLNGKWELIYTTSKSILQTSRPKFLRSTKNYQGINTDTLRAQNMESWPFFNQVTADLTPINTKRVAVKFDTFKLGGLLLLSKFLSGRDNTLKAKTGKEHYPALIRLPSTGMDIKLPIKAPGRGRGELEISYLDEELRISRGDKGNLFILKMVDPSYRVPV